MIAEYLSLAAVLTAEPEPVPEVFVARHLHKCMDLLQLD